MANNFTWTNLLGTSGSDLTNAVTIALDGSIYVSGYTYSNLDGQTNSGGADVFITKYLPDGTKAWTRLAGTSGTDEALALTTGTDGAIYVSGFTQGRLDGQTNNGGLDAFISKYSPDGTKAWTKLLGTSGLDRSLAVTTGSDGAIYVSGYTYGNLDGQSNNGTADAFITKYLADGTIQWTRLLGTSAVDAAYALTIGADGAIYTSGFTRGSLDGESNNGGNDAFITKYLADGTKVWTRLLGTLNEDHATALTTGSDGAIYVSGYTQGSLDGQTGSGYWDAFITKYLADGTKVWTRLLGTSVNEFAYALTTGSDGAIYVSGETAGNLDGQINSGGDDAFIAKYLPDGTKVWTKLLGSTGLDASRALATGIDGNIYIGGDTTSNLGGQTYNGGETDAFLTQLLVNSENTSLSIAPTNAIQTEGNSGTKAFTFTVTRSGNLAGTHAVNWAVTGTGTHPANATDFGETLPSGSLTFAAGETSKVITVNVRGDTTLELDESFAVTLSNPTNGAILSLTTATGIIQSDDFIPPTLAIAPTNATQTEGNSGTKAFTFSVTRSDNTLGTNSVNWAVTGTGTHPVNATDFGGILPSGTLTFSAGETAKVITVNVSGDTTVELDEGFTVTLSNPTNAAIITPATATGTIQNDDTRLAIAPTNAAQTEGNSGTKAFTFTVTRAGNTSGTHAANWTVTGTGTNPANATDFGGILPSGTVSFAAGETAKTISINVNGDTTVEQNETFSITLSSPTNGATLSTATATGTIQNDDTRLAIAPTNAAQTEGNSGTKAFTFTVTRAGNTSGIHAANWTLTGTGTYPANATDFGEILPSGTVSFAAGETAKTISINVNGDTTVEQNETFSITLSSPTNGATLSTATATGTIQNDDIPNQSPTDLTLSNNNIAENLAIGTVIGNFSTTDPDVGNTFTYSLVSGTGSTHNSLFTLQNNQLKTNAVFDYETLNSYSIRVRSTDGGGLFYEEQFTISVINTNEFNEIIGDDEDNNLIGTAGNDYIEGGEGDDTLNGNGGQDTLMGGEDNDTYIIYSTGNVITENSSEGTDTVRSYVNHTLGANLENLTLMGTFNINATGNSLRNTLTGNSGHNRLNGGAGNDSLIGGAGADTLSGGIGSDRFIFNSVNEGIDRITDFNVTDDTIAISAVGFGNGLVAGAVITSEQFGINTSATNNTFTTLNQRFMYNTATGRLFFDADGSGTSASSVHLATLNTGLALTHVDILVV